jgi:hypothetical protein
MRHETVTLLGCVRNDERLGTSFGQASRSKQMPLYFTDNRTCTSSGTGFGVGLS